MDREPDGEYTDRMIQEVARRPGGWALHVSGDCRPVFVPESAVTTPPAAGDTLRIHAGDRIEVIRSQ